MSPPLRVPLEVLERILFFALGGDESLATPFTCVEPITPPVGTSHLLLVSKGITALCLPHYWRSVTILRADDWVKLWDPEDGLFAGERGEERASWVTEIRVNVLPRAAIPLADSIMEVPYDDDGDGHLLPDDPLVSLEPVPFSRLKHLCFFRSLGGLASDHHKDRLLPGDNIWKATARRDWEKSQPDRLEDDLGGFDSDDEDREDESYHLQWLADDQETFDRDQEHREMRLDELRADARSEMLCFDDAEFETFRIPIDDYVYSLVRDMAYCASLPRLTLYAPSKGGDVTSLSMHDLRSDIACDFVGILPEDRATLAERFIQGHKDAVKRWCWVNEDGTKVPISS